MSALTLDLMIGSVKPDLTYNIYDYDNSNTVDPVYRIKCLENNKFSDFFEITDSATFDALNNSSFSLAEPYGISSKIRVCITHSDDGQAQTADYVDFAYVANGEDSYTVNELGDVVTDRTMRKVRLVLTADQTFAVDAYANTVSGIPEFNAPGLTNGSEYYDSAALDLFTYFRNRVLNYLGNHPRKTGANFLKDVRNWSAVVEDPEGGMTVKDGVVGGENNRKYEPLPIDFALRAIVRQMSLQNPVTGGANIYYHQATAVDTHFYDYLLYGSIKMNQDNKTSESRWPIPSDDLESETLALTFASDVAGFLLTTDIPDWDPDSPDMPLNDDYKNNAKLILRMNMVYGELENLYAIESGVAPERTFLISFETSDPTYGASLSTTYPLLTDDVNGESVTGAGSEF